MFAGNKKLMMVCYKSVAVDRDLFPRVSQLRKTLLHHVTQQGDLIIALIYDVRSIRFHFGQCRERYLYIYIYK